MPPCRSSRRPEEALETFAAEGLLGLEEVFSVRGEKRFSGGFSMSDQGYSFEAANPRVAEALRQLSLILHGKEAVLIRLLACVFAGGHSL